MDNNKDDHLAEVIKGQERLEVRVGALEKGQELLREDVRTWHGDVEELKVGQRRLEAGQERLESQQRRLESQQRRLEAGQQRLEAGQQRLVGYFEFLREMMERQSADVKRHIEVLTEHHSTEKAGQGEGIRANRERLDDHESRIRNLEAS